MYIIYVNHDSVIKQQRDKAFLINETHIFHKNSLNLIETVREKLKKYTSSTKAKLLNLLVINRKNEM